MGTVMGVDQVHPDQTVLEEAARVLAAGGCAVLPTDSVYGIGAAMVPDNPGHRRIFVIKDRPRTQTLPLLIADPSDLEVYGAHVRPWVRTLAEGFWPGALTVVVEASSLVPREYVAADGTVALRVPDSNLVRELIRRVGVPLATTSANTHGKPSATDGRDLEEALVEGADLVLDGGPAPVGVASTIVDGTGDEPKVLREGGIPTDVLLANLG